MFLYINQLLSGYHLSLLSNWLILINSGEPDDKLLNITNINNDIEVTINNNHWTFYPISVIRGNNYKFNLQLDGEYIITTVTYIVSHKKRFDGS